MDSDRAVQQETDEDRVVSRRVDNPTRAEPGDQDAYATADPVVRAEEALDGGGEGAESERAARELDADDESEPTRSE